MKECVRRNSNVGRSSEDQVKTESIPGYVGLRNKT
jgi:hypothetical protein